MKFKNTTPSYRQTIITKYLGPTETRGSRISARTSSGCLRRIFEWDNGLNIEDNLASAAQMIIEQMQWGGQWVGGLVMNVGYVWVDASSLDDK